MIGHLYRYPHPHDPTRFIYVGQGAKRDQPHRSGESSFGRRFKRDFPNIELSQPILEVFEIVDQDHLNVLETVWMFQYKTWHEYSGGMNLTFPGSADYASMGKVGGIASALIPGHHSRAGKIGGRIGGKIGGKINGKLSVDNGRLASLRTPEHQAEAGRRCIEIHGNRITPEMCSMGGKIGGRLAWDSGQLSSVTTKESCSKGGVASSAKNHANKNEQGKSLHAIKAGLIGGKKGGPAACHLRWHVRRNIVSSVCSLCQQS
jgi:hypothetical protein